MYIDLAILGKIITLIWLIILVIGLIWLVAAPVETSLYSFGIEAMFRLFLIVIDVVLIVATVLVYGGVYWW
jgi:hypothetical protein